MKLLPLHFARKNKILVEEDILYYLSETSVFALTEAQRFFSQKLFLRRILPDLFEIKLNALYEKRPENTLSAMDTVDLYQLTETLEKTEELLFNTSDAPIIQFINSLFQQAIKDNASDIHIETYEDKVTVRFRIDGLLHTILEPKKSLSSFIVSRIKIMAKLNIAEKRLPQDGRFSLKILENTFDIRISTLPSQHGERIVMRILNKQAQYLQLSQLGLTPTAEKTVRHLIQKPHGILLITGPTGAGKTTTLYAILNSLDSQKFNILTIEDPIEYAVPHVGQTQVNPKINLTFANGLRAILRQDPDIIMVGEIRDQETAQVAIQASLTGHLVLSTLHTNTALGAMTRLQDLGIEPFLIANSVIGVVSQRLVRLLCPHCKTTDSNGSVPVGCARCHHSGYHGRVGIYEVIAVDDDLRHAITQKQPLQTHAESLQQAALVRVQQGETSLSEMLRVVGDADATI